MSDNKKAAGGGITFLGALGVLFIGLKLAGFISWPWWLVLLPIWGPWALALVVLLALLLRSIGG